MIRYSCVYFYPEIMNRFQKFLIISRSANHSLAEEAELEAEDKYFDKLEKKEAMEEKMLNTRSVSFKHKQIR